MSNINITTSDFAALRERWVDLLTARREFDSDDPLHSRTIRDRTEAAKIYLDELDPCEVAVFTNLSLKSNDGILQTYMRVFDLAVVWSTPGSRMYQSSGLLDVIRGSLRRANAIGYNPNVKAYGNWWTWEIGIPINLSNTLTIVYDHLSLEEIVTNCAAIDFHVPDPWFNKPEGQGRGLSRGSARSNLCRAVIIRSLLDENVTKLIRACSGLQEAWSVVPKGDGFREDGSFIFHGAVPYTGSYGIAILHGLSDVFALLGAILDRVISRRALYRLIERAYIPIVVRGRVVDSVRGRSICRAELRGRNETVTLIRALAIMSEGVGQETADHWMSYCKAWLADLGDSVQIDSLSTARAIQKVHRSPVMSAPNPDGITMYGEMDRVIVRRTDWSAVISGASRRVAFYEYGNGENPIGFYTGAGMTLLYMGDGDHYDDNYWPTVDWYHLPGTTSDQLRLPDGAGGSFGRALCPGEWTGGSVAKRDGMPDAAIWAQHIVGLGETSLNARKFWLSFGDAIVALGADISSRGGAGVDTTVENRMSRLRFGAEVNVDGSLAELERGKVINFANPRWLHLEDVGGFVFGASTELSILDEVRRGSWSSINEAGPSAELTRRFTKLWIQHASGRSADSYEYAIFPNASVKQTEYLSAHRPYRVLSNTSHIQAAAIGPSVRGFAFWAAGHLEELLVSGPCTVVISEGLRERTVVVTPQGDEGVLTVELLHPGWILTTSPDGVNVSYSENQSVGPGGARNAHATRLSIASGPRRQVALKLVPELDLFSDPASGGYRERS